MGKELSQRRATSDCPTCRFLEFMGPFACCMAAKNEPKKILNPKQKLVTRLGKCQVKTFQDRKAHRENQVILDKEFVDLDVYFIKMVDSLKPTL